jgi:hypothetical protein
MGLVMYAYSSAREGQHEEYYTSARFNIVAGEYEPTASRPMSIAKWDKHPNLHGWFEKLWNCKNGIPLSQSQRFEENKYPAQCFNQVEVELTWEDLDQLELAIKNNKLPITTGFYFGKSADDHYKETDLKFIQAARADLFIGLKVFYNSSW